MMFSLFVLINFLLVLLQFVPFVQNQMNQNFAVLFLTFHHTHTPIWLLQLIGLIIFGATVSFERQQVS